VKFTGSAPNFSCDASCFALSSVNEPEICALPFVIAAFIDGAEMTLPSSRIANWFCAVPEV
jgi:hypothetical protein